MGYPHPDFLFAQLSHSQFLDWKALYGMEPWGEHRDDLRMARIVWAVFQSQSKRELDESKYRFEWKYANPAPKTAEEYRMKAMGAWAGAGGGITIAEG